MAKKKKISLKDIIKGKFLIDDGSMQNWRFVMFLVLLAFISISSSHWVDRKVVKINELDKNVADLKAQYTYAHRELMQLKLEPQIIKKTEHLGLKKTEQQPYLLVKEND